MKQPLAWMSVVALLLLALPAVESSAQAQDAVCEMKARLRGPIYDPNGTGLEPGVPEILDELTKIFLERCPGKLLIIEVHAVELPTAELNQRLSELRALLLRHEFVRRGIPEGRTMPVGMGSSKPLIDDPAALDNRRVTFRIVE